MFFYNLFLNILFLPFLIIFILVAILNKRLSFNFFQRISFIKNKPEGKVIWFHCSSFGEVNAIKSVIEKLKKRKKKIYITTLTDTGFLNAKKIVGDNCSIIPFDFNFLIKRFIKKIKPEILIIEETEIWPNLIWQTSKFKIPIIYINALITEKSYKAYKLLKFIFSKVLKRIEIFFVQNQETEFYLKKLGVDKNKIKYIGVTKFDIKIPKINKLKIFKADSKIIVAGSTHHNEEKILIETFKKLKNEFPNLKLIIAPRHIERLNEIVKLLETEKIKFNLFSKIKNFCNEEVLIIDKMGVLMEIYNLSNISFVGGTLVKVGGHNPLEPASLKKPVLFGPFIKNNFVAFQLLLENKAGIMVKDASELYEKIKFLLKNKNEAKKMGLNAYKILKTNSGASQKIVDYICKNYLKK